MTKTSYKVPYDPSGNLLHDIDWYLGFDKSAIVWQYPEPFVAWLSLDVLHRSGHAVYYEWTNIDSKTTYPMLANDMLDLLKTSTISGGIIYGEWEPVKRGRAYGIRKVKT